MKEADLLPAAIFIGLLLGLLISSLSDMRRELLRLRLRVMEYETAKVES